MTKAEVAAKMAEKTGFTQEQSRASLTAALEVVQEALTEGTSVTFVGFGTFSLRKRKARTGVKPGTSEQIQIPASTTVAFKPGKTLKDAVNK